ncbi:beta-catenin-like protein 1 [Lepeophtheirus salmonis]|uniref:Beta-catenin-like protein 1 n=1 Tax=Lepeophtheirus salmonis TaxID=72036 RepID=A0A0K2TRQ7_LEPSM|nr:beta-catenin-like protein 1 [Lepeophtheirus salmonis]
MDVNELLNFKPKMAPKRPLNTVEDEYEDNPDETYEMRAAKKLKAKSAAKKRLEEERLAVLEAEVEQQSRKNPSVENDDDDDEVMEDEDRGLDDELNESKLKKIVLTFEKKTLKNQELRIKYPDSPEKFMDSEVNLHDSVQDLRIIATAPYLYPALVNLQIIPSLLGLLSHENSDISIAVIDLIQELTDIDTLHESQDGADALIQTLSNNQIAPLLVQNLERLSTLSDDDNDGIHNTLAIIENLIEFRPQMCREAVDAGILVWLTKRLKVRIEFDANKLYASEILSILLQHEEKNRATFGEMNGAIDSMLQQLAFYKRHEPNSVEENEMLENVFDCLCSLLLHAPNRDRFLKGEGLQLMNLMLREKKSSRNGALKVLTHALSGHQGKDCCNKLVDVLGLRTIFPLFMKTPKKSKRKGVTADEHEERTVSIVSSLLRNIRTGTQRQRLLAKFTENDFEKVDRLLEMHFKYLEKVDATERLLLRQKEDLDEDETYLRRLEGGLFTLQLVDYIIMEICCNSGASTSNIKARVHQILNQRNANVKTIRNIVREYAGNLGQEQEGESDKQHLLQLVDKF